MFSHHSLENQINDKDVKIKELQIQIENLDNSVSDLLNSLNVTSEQLTAYLEKPEHFTKENWTELVEQKHQLEEKLLRELANINNPQKTKKSYSNLHVQRHWLHVR